MAERADAWNTSGTIEEVRAKLEILAAHGAEVGRDVGGIEKTISFPIVLRDDRTAAEERFRALLDHNGADTMGPGPVLLGSPAEVADAIHPYRDLGFETVIVRMPGPYDPETIQRMPDVQERLRA